VKEIHIGGHAVGSAQRFLSEQPRLFDCLAITDSTATLPETIRELSREVLHLAFDDITSPFFGFQAPDLARVQEGIAWSAGRERLLIACHAGISRSSALAYLIACTDRSPREALALLDPGVHSPNARVVRLGAQALGNSAIWQSFVEWCAEHDPLGWERRQQFAEQWAAEMDSQ
jgi:predicted protein tyrosine phosphatase